MACRHKVRLRGLRSRWKTKRLGARLTAIDERHRQAYAGVAQPAAPTQSPLPRHVTTALHEETTMPDPAPEPQIVAMGGASFDPTVGAFPLLRYTLALTGQANPRVCLIPTAGGEKSE